MTDMITPSSSIPVRETQYCTFRLGNLLFGVEVLCVQEVLLPQTITEMPLAPEVVRGLINLRGQIVTAVDLRRRLGISEESEEAAMNVVVKTGESAFSLLVDEIGDVVNVYEEAFEAPPKTLNGPARDLILGVYKLDGELLLVLDIEQAIAIPTAVAQ